MKIERVFFQGMEIPIIKGALHLLSYREGMEVEIELIVHPTIISFLDGFSLKHEKFYFKTESGNEIKGKFSIYLGESSILLTSKLHEVEGAEGLAELPMNKSSLLYEGIKGISLNQEFEERKDFIQTTILKSLLENEVLDETNRLFIKTILEKLKKGDNLNSFDQFILNEVNYHVQKAMANTSLPSKGQKMIKK